MQQGIDALATIPRMQLNAVDQRPHQICGFVADGRIVQLNLELLDLFGIDIR